MNAFWKERMKRNYSHAWTPIYKMENVDSIFGANVDH